MKVYYAHPLFLYGSEREEREKQFIREQFPNLKLIDPSDSSIIKPGLGFNVMEPYLRAVASSERVVCSPSEVNANIVPRGVFTEALEALSRGIDCYLIQVAEHGYKLEQVVRVLTKIPTNWKMDFGELEVRR